jgi:hypothetical protein
MLSDELAQRESVRLPADFRLYRDRGGSHLPPWTFLTDEQALAAKEMVVSQYPQYHDCLPFADTDASDDVAVFTPEGRVREVHMFASEGWEGGGEFPNFRDWLRATFQQVYIFLETAKDTR